jgi:molybdate transport system regulatory protein
VKIAYKIWLENNGKAFGDGPHELLRRVAKTRSLHRAAREMGMAYSKAWKLIQSLEKRLGFDLIERQVGGPCGGGSSLTPEARGLMEKYAALRKDVDEVLKKMYRRHFERGGRRR